MNNFKGKWKFSGIESRDEEFQMIVLSPEVFLNAPIDEDYDEEEKAHEMTERLGTINTVLEVTDDKIYTMMPLPEEVSQEEIEEAVKAGAVEIRDGMMLIEAYDCEIRDGELYMNSGIQGEIFGEATDPWEKVSFGDELVIVIMHFTRI